MGKLRVLAIGVFSAFASPLAAVAADDAALQKVAQGIFQPLPKDLATPELPITQERVELGRMLFFDPRLTTDGNIACSSCHQPAFYGTDARPRAIGVKQWPHPHNAPTVLNAGILGIIHWRGDRDSLEDQAAKAVTSPITSGQPDERAVIDRLSRIPGYAPLFKAAFAAEPQSTTLQNLAKAISAYERTLLTPSPFDAYLAGNQQALSATARIGLEKFIKTGCVACHNGAGVGGATFQKFGVVEDYWKATGSDPIDKGRFEITKDSADLYVFRVASLRNVAMTLFPRRIGRNLAGSRQDYGARAAWGDPERGRHKRHRQLSQELDGQGPGEFRHRPGAAVRLGNSRQMKVRQAGSEDQSACHWAADC
jgi:cytochrome c peroxidase